MQTKYGFTKGLNQDFATDKRDPNSYYDALNIKVSTDTGLTTASITNEIGNELLFKIPTRVGSIYTIIYNKVGIGGAAWNPYDTDVIILTLGGGITRTITKAPSTAWYTINDVYNALISNVGVAFDISAGRYSVAVYENQIVITELSDLTGCYTYGSTHTSVSTILGASNPYIVGMGTMRDWIVIFTTSGGTDGQIWKCKYNKVTEEIDNIGLANELDPAYHLVYHGYLGFSEDYRVGEVISRYQDSTHGKIYFVDGNHVLRHINILDPNSMALPLGALEMFPNVTMTQPEPTSVIKGGLYKAGMVQYAYQLFNVGGAETTFSPASGLVHLTISNDLSANSSTYKGTALEEDTGKAVIVTVNNIDNSFEYLRLVSIYYETKEGSPVVTVISEKKIPTTKTLTITDTGDTTLDVYTVSEYNGYGSRLIIPKTITTKNNFLIAANFTEEYFDVDDWDARAYRWDGAGTFMCDGIAQSNVDLVSETADCIFTEVDYATYKYNDTTGRLGGKGKNISYEFKLISIPIDNSTDTDLYAQSISNQKWGDSTDSHYLDSSYTDVIGYSNYANPLNHSQLVGYTRGETYRFGIVFFDEKGRNSFVKWIADIRMPDINEEELHPLGTETPTYNTDTVGTGLGTDKWDYATVFNCLGGGGVQANILGVDFTVENVPVGYKYRIVRVRREDTDKTILGQGLIGFTQEDVAGSINTQGYAYDALNGHDDTVDGLSIAGAYDYALTFKSPEVSFIDSISPREGDTIKPIYEIEAGVDILHTITTSSNWYEGVVINKIINCPLISTVSNINVIDGIKVTPHTEKDINEVSYSFDSGGTISVFYNYFKYGYFDSYKGTSLFIGTDTHLGSMYTAGIRGLIIANYTRDVELSRYGGRGYYERFNNTYIACGNLRNYTDTTSIVFGGDTFITYFDYLNNIFRPGNWNDSDAIPPSSHQRTNIVYFPVESTICTELRHGSCYSRGDTSYKLNETTAEGIALYTDYEADLGAYDTALEDIYLYNTVYSAEPIAKTFTPKPQYFTNNFEYDYKIIASEKHINGQLTDSWLKFLFNNYTEVNSAYGAINKLITHNNQVYFFQDNAYGIVSLNDRQVLKDDSGAPLVLGTGGILDSFKYISEKAGCKSKFSVVDTGDALYFFDLNNRKFMKYSNGQDVQLSDVKGLSSYFRNFNFGTAVVNDKTADLLGIHGVFDPIGKRVLYTFLGTDTSTVGYNQFLDSFESFYSYKPGIYCENDGLIMSVNPSDNTEVYLHGVGNRGRFYGTYYDSSITLLANQQAEFKKVFTNLEYDSVVYDGVSIPDGGAELYNDTFDTIRMWNSYQDSGNITLTSPTNIRRRFRTWRYQLPKVSGNRLLDYHLFIKLSFTNGVGFSGSTSKVLRTSDIIVNHLIPNI